MSLKYALIENLLTDAPNDYMAQVQEVKSHNIDSITEKMLQGGSTITKTDTLAVLNAFFEVVSQITREGETVNTDLFKTRLSLSGVFDSAADTYDATQHSIRINALPGRLLTEPARQISPQKVEATGLLPHILQVKDSVSGSVNENLTSGGVVEITGSRLKIAGEDTANGVWFVPETGDALKAATLVYNKPARLIVIAPVLAASSYTLEIKTQYGGGGTLLRTTRTGSFDKTLTVA